MLTINFYPESDKPEFIRAAKEYQAIWKKDGEKIIGAIEKVSGLRFKTKIINALTFDGISYSVPLQLESNYNLEQKRGTIIHELCHRLLVDNNFYIGKQPSIDQFEFVVHKIVYLILYDVWVFLYGEGFAKKELKHEKSYNSKPHNDAWNWALSLTKEERTEEFKKCCGPTGN